MHKRGVFHSITIFQFLRIRFILPHIFVPLSTGFCFMRARVLCRHGAIMLTIGKMIIMNILNCIGIGITITILSNRNIGKCSGSHHNSNGRGRGRKDDLPLFQNSTQLTQLKSDQRGWRRERRGRDVRSREKMRSRRRERRGRDMGSREKMRSRRWWSGCGVYNGRI